MRRCICWWCVSVKHLPSLSSKILHRYQGHQSFNDQLHYRSVIIKLNYLEKVTHPNISYATHQYACFQSDPKAQHSDAVEHMTRYLKGTQGKGLIIDPKSNQSLEVYSGTDFCGSWNRDTTMSDPSTAKSRTGFVILVAGCPLVWTSWLQTMVTLSTTDAKYMVLSQSLREVIPVMHLLQEFKKQGFQVYTESEKVHFKAYEDNYGMLEMARTHKVRPRTKHINVIFHHFCE